MTEEAAAEPETQNNAIASSADNIKNAVKNLSLIHIYGPWSATVWAVLPEETWRHPQR